MVATPREGGTEPSMVSDGALPQMQGSRTGGGGVCVCMIQIVERNSLQILTLFYYGSYLICIRLNLLDNFLRTDILI